MSVSAPGKPKDPFSAALDALRQDLRNGKLVQGEPLTVTDIAETLGLSATPVREALSRLAGERLIEDRRGRGYFAIRPDVSDLVELYGLRRLYLAEALTADAGAAAFPTLDSNEPALPAALQVSQILDWVVARAGNHALFDAYRQVSERLAPSLRVEAQVFSVSEELSDLQAGLNDRAALAAALTALHEARRLRAAELMRAIRASANIASL